MSTETGPKPGDAWNHMTVIGRSADRVCVIDRRDTRHCLKFMLPPGQRARAGLRRRMQRWRAGRAPQRDENHAELRAWLQLSARLSPQDLQPHLATVLGMYRTAYGQALCCERVTLPDGAPAPSLSALLLGASNYPAAPLCAAVDQFEQWLLKHRIPLFDVHAGNLLVVGDEPGPRLVCVDVRPLARVGRIARMPGWFGATARRRIRRWAQRLRQQIRAALPA